MSTEANKAVQRRVFEALNRRDVNALAALSAPTCTFYGFAPQPLDLEDYKQFTTWSFAVFPDLQFIVEDLVAEGDTVTTRFTERGTQQGELQGFPPTGKQAAWTGICISRFADGKIVEVRGEFDRLGMLQQLGLLPAIE